MRFPRLPKTLNKSRPKSQTPSDGSANSVETTQVKSSSELATLMKQQSPSTPADFDLEQAVELQHMVSHDYDFVSRNFLGFQEHCAALGSDESARKFAKLCEDMFEAQASKKQDSEDVVEIFKQQQTHFNQMSQKIDSKIISPKIASRRLSIENLLQEQVKSPEQTCRSTASSDPFIPQTLPKPLIKKDSDQFPTIAKPANLALPIPVRRPVMHTLFLPNPGSRQQRRAAMQNPGNMHLPATRTQNFVFPNASLVATNPINPSPEKLTLPTLGRNGFITSQETKKNPAVFLKRMPNRMEF